MYIYVKYKTKTSTSIMPSSRQCSWDHDDVIKWKHLPRYWPFVRGIHRSPVNSPHNGQWRGALLFSLICVWINGWVNNREAGDLSRYRAYYDVTVMCQWWITVNEHIIILILHIYQHFWVSEELSLCIHGSIITCQKLGLQFPWIKYVTSRGTRGSRAKPYP